jgi:hypothetical protein
VGARILRAVNLIEQAEGQGHAGSEMSRVVEDAQGTVLGPRLTRLVLSYLETALEPDWTAGKHQVSVETLAPGMVIAADLCTGRGVKLLPKNSTLTRVMIERIRSFQQLDPILDEIYVYDRPPAPVA